jgi:hypothetical protein
LLPQKIEKLFYYAIRVLPTFALVKMLNNRNAVGFEEAITLVVVCRTFMKAITIYLKNSPFSITARLRNRLHGFHAS